MNTISRWLILTALIVAALICYTIGFKPGFGFFLIAGAAFELSFWLALFRKRDGENSG